MPILDREPPAVNTSPAARPVVYRHRLPTRIWHWLNAAVILVMLMSGLMIFNAHPRLYWGQYGANPDPSWLQIGNSGEQGFVRMGNHTFRSTGFLGVWGGPGDQSVYTAFPGWLTIPSTYDLALARHWHLTLCVDDLGVKRHEPDVLSQVSAWFAERTVALSGHEPQQLIVPRTAASHRSRNLTVQRAPGLRSTVKACPADPVSR
jgi:hypothetical protein